MALAIAWLLGQFKPTQYSYPVIFKELGDYLHSKGVISGANMGKFLPVGIRTPDEQYNPDIFPTWHREGMPADPASETDTPACKSVIVWSNGPPTRLRILATKEELTQFNPFDVIWFDNILVQHNKPDPVPGRWFARLYDPVFKSMI